MIVPASVLAAIRQPAFVYRREGTVEAANDLAVDWAGGPLAGMTPADVIARLSIRRRDGTPLLPDELPVVRALRGEEVVDLPLAAATADGRTVYVLATASPIRHGDAIAGALDCWQDVTARVRAEEAVRESEARQRALAGSLDVERELLATALEHLPVGVWIADAHGHLVGKNPEADRIWAGDAPLVKSIGEYPAYLALDAGTGEPLAPEEYPVARALLTGRPAGPVELRICRFDGTHRTVLGSAEPIRDRDGQLAGAVGINLDITGQKRAEAALKESEERQAFLLELNDALAPLADPGEVQVAAARVLGEHLGADWVAYFEVDGDDYVIVNDYAPAVPSVAGRHRIAAFGPRLLAEYRAGRTAVGTDTETDPDLSPAERATFASVGARAYVGVPLLKAGAFVAGLGVNAAAPRAWTSVEVALVEETADRTWAAVERARVEAALRASEERYRELFSSMGEAFALHEVVLDDAGAPVDYRFLALNPAFEAMTGFPADALVGLTAREVHPELGSWYIEQYGRVATTGGPVRFEACFPPLGRWFAVRAYSAGPGRFASVFSDVTERRRAEEALRVSLERQAFGQRAARSVFWDWDMRTETLTWSPEFYDLFGLPPTAPASFDLFGSVLHPDDREDAMARIASSIEEHRPLENEYRIVLPDGTVRWIGANGDTTYDREGRPVRMAGICVDITDRRRADEALRASEELTRSILDRSFDALYRRDLETGRAEYYSPAIQAITGFSVEEAMAMSADEVAARVHPDDLAAVTAGEVALQPGASEGSVDYRFLRKDGTYCWVSDRFQLVPGGDGRPRYREGIIRDITERKRAEEQLARFDEQRQLALDAAGMGWWHYDLFTEIASYDARYCEIFDVDGTSRPNEEILARIHPDDLPGVWARVETALDPADPRPYSVDYRILMPDGAVRWIEARGIATFEGTGMDRHATSLVGTVRDITELKRDEEELRTYAEHLRRSNEDLERFAYVSSHDLQEPLRLIVSFSQLLARRYRGVLDEDADEYIDFIVEGGIRMQTLILDLLAYSRVNTKAQELRPIDAEAVMAAVERQLAPSLAEAGATLAYDPLPTVTADPLQLEQVFSNLVSNAIKFRRPGAPLRIHVSTRRLDDVWEFSVADNGIGIDPRYHDQIFVIFQRLHTRDAYPGTGIGLAIVQRIIDRHGGTIRVESTPGEGTTFFFTLPAA